VVEGRFPSSGEQIGLETTSHGTRPGERKTRLLAELPRDREPDVLRFTHDLIGRLRRIPADALTAYVHRLATAQRPAA
jgi:hypothetical protein